MPQITPYLHLPHPYRLAIERMDADATLRNRESFDLMCTGYGARNLMRSDDERYRDAAWQLAERRFGLGTVEVSREILEEAAELLHGYVDVVDSPHGPTANKAMRALQLLEVALGKRPAP